MSISSLLPLIATPHAAARPRSTAEWAGVERALGTKLPDDYKAFIDLFGGGRVGRFITVFSPFATNPNVELLQQQSRQGQVLADLQSNGEQVPFALFPAPGGLLIAGMTDNGDPIFWLTRGIWGIVVNEARSPEWERFDGFSLTAFLAGVISGSVTCTIFPRFVKSIPVDFEPVT